MDGRGQTADRRQGDRVAGGLPGFRRATFPAPPEPRKGGLRDLRATGRAGRYGAQALGTWPYQRVLDGGRSSRLENYIKPGVRQGQPRATTSFGQSCSPRSPSWKPPAGDYERAQAAVDEALALFRGLGVPRRLWVHQLINVGWIAIHRRDFVRAHEALEEYLAAEILEEPDRHRQRSLQPRAGRGLRRRPRPGRLPLPPGARLRPGATRQTDDRRSSLRHERRRSDGRRRRAGRSAPGAADGVKVAMESPRSAPEQFIDERYLELASSPSEDTRERARDEGTAL